MVVWFRWETAQVWREVLAVPFKLLSLFSFFSSPFSFTRVGVGVTSVLTIVGTVLQLVVMLMRVGPAVGEKRVSARARAGARRRLGRQASVGGLAAALAAPASEVRVVILMLVVLRVLPLILSCGLILFLKSVKFLGKRGGKDWDGRW